MADHAAFRAEADAAIAAIVSTAPTRDTYLAVDGEIAYLEVSSRGVDRGVSGNVNYDLAGARVWVARRAQPFAHTGIMDRLAEMVDQISAPGFWEGMASVYAITDQDISTGEPEQIGDTYQQVIDLVVALTP